MTKQKKFKDKVRARAEKTGESYSTALRNMTDRGTTADGLGQCRLCLRSGVQLMLSHIIPAWAYRRVTEDPNAPKVQYVDGRVDVSSAQVKERMLCAECERRFDLRENYVAELAYRDGRTPLIDLLSKAPELGRDENIYWVSAAGVIDTIRTVYFGVSVLWRAAVARRTDAGRPQLGEMYEEQLRQFLLEEAELPLDARLQLAVIADPLDGESDYRTAIAFPSTRREEFCHRHAFLVCGLQFELAIGKRLPEEYKSTCLYRSPDRPVVVIAGGRLGTIRGGKEQFSSASKSARFLHLMAKQNLRPNTHPPPDR